MNQAIALGVLRHALTLAGGALVSRGYLDDGALEQVVGAVLVLISVGYSAWTSHRAAKTAVAAQAAQDALK